MKLFRSPTIRRQLLMLLLALAVPFLAFLVISSARQAEHDREFAGMQMLGVSRLIAARLDDHVGDIAQLLSVLSAAVEPTLEASERNDAVLRNLATRLPPQVSNLSVWTATGEIAGTLDPRLRAAGVNVVGRKFFRDAMWGAKLAIEAPIATVSSDQMVGVFALRMERQGHAAGVVAVSVPLKVLQALLAPPGTIPAGGVVTVSDVSGVVLARSVDPDRWIGQNLMNGPGGLADSLRRRDGVRHETSADGVERIAGFTMATRTPWLVYVGIPADVALASVQTRLIENIAAGGAMMVVGLLLAVGVAKRISSPLLQLSADAAVLERGDLSHRSAVGSDGGGGEIGVLASTLNRMAEALQQRTRSLEASQERLRHLAEHDHLTGLPNRALFLDRLSVAIRRAARERSTLALLFLDIDHFKAVNDTLGHEAGDDLLRTFALTLQSSMRNSDTVARLAGDEFTIVLESIGDAAAALHVAQKLVEAARKTVGDGADAIAISASIGVAILQPGDNAAALLRRADDALYEAKRAGRDRYACADDAAALAAAEESVS